MPGRGLEWDVSAMGRFGDGNSSAIRMCLGRGRVRVRVRFKVRFRIRVRVRARVRLKVEKKVIAELASPKRPRSNTFFSGNSYI